MATSDVIEKLESVLAARKSADPESSYVARLHSSGLDKILEKVGEEAVETIIAAKGFPAGGERDRVIAETADLWFHSLVMLTHLGIPAAEVFGELERRFGTSGLAEKASRGN